MSQNENASNTQEYDDVSSIDIDRLTQCHDWSQKYRLIMQWSYLVADKKELHLEKYLIKGCETKAWLHMSIINGRYCFFFDSESRIIKGLAAILLTFINHKTASQLNELNLSELLRQLGLEQRLTPSRSNGFYAIVRKALSLVHNLQD